MTKIKELFDAIYLNQKQLTSGQAEFVDSLKRYYHKNKILSDKQLEALSEIFKSFKITEIRFTMNK